MIVYWLLFLFVILTLLSYIILNRDIFSPSVFMGIAYILAISCTIYNIKAWSINMRIKTLFILVLSYMIFMLMEVFIKLLWQKKLNSTLAKQSSKLINKKNSEGRYIIIPNCVCISFDIFAVMVAFWYFRGAYQIACNHGYSGVGNFLTYFRNAASYGILSADETMNPIVEQLFKFETVGAYVFSYILINNLMTSKWNFVDTWKDTFKYRIPIYVFFVATISTAGRLQYIRFAVALLLMTYLQYNQKHNWKKNISRKIFLYGGIALVVIMVAFFLMGNIVGRNVTQSPMDYLTRYAGSPIYMFDKYLQSPLPRTKYFGGETFYGIYTGLRKLGLTKYHEIYHLEFRTLGRQVLGSNTYTAIRRYYQDFGVTGVAVFQVLMSLIVNSYYYFVIRSINRSEFKEIIYCFFYYSIPLHPINETFFSVGFSIGSIIYILDFILLWNLIKMSTRVRIKWGLRRSLI
ncbi:MAG: O-antigen polymerase [Lachnospiraceae bacterium]|nr:O-antigen polymerase [Lachnospiraceae bacterium]